MRKRYNLSIPVLAFLVPLIYRVIVEIFSNPYTVGYDVFVYYIPYLTGYSSPSAIELYGYSPLYYVIAGAAQPLFGDPLLTAKVIAIALQALLGLSLYLWASTTLTRRMSLLFSLSSSFFFTTLRITWDLHRNVLGLVLMLLALYSLEKVKERKWRILTVSALGILTALAHPFLPMIMIMMLLPKILRRDFEALYTSLLAAATLGSTLYAQFISKSSLYSAWLINDLPLGSIQLFPSGWIALQFLIYIIVPLLPVLLLVLAERRREHYQALKKGCLP